MSSSGSVCAIDSVRGDIESLASHMRDCAMAQGRWAGVRAGLQQAHALTAGRLVTVGCLAIGLVIGLFIAV